jgi:hypothetical protein
MEQFFFVFGFLRVFSFLANDLGFALTGQLVPAAAHW